MTKVNPNGVVPALPPELVSVSPPSVHWARQVVLTIWLVPEVVLTAKEILAGMVAVLLEIRQPPAVVAVPVKPQEPTMLAFAVPTLTVIAPAASNPVKPTRNAARGDIRIIKCLSAVAYCPLAPFVTRQRRHRFTPDPVTER